MHTKDICLENANLDRFWSKVRKSEGCWEWQGTKLVGTGGGYGIFYIQSKGERRSRSFLAHRISLMIKLGRPIHYGMFACHTCDNKACVNPAHLYEGTPSDNSRDRFKRQPCRLFGEAVHRAKLNDEKVLEIRSLYKSGIGSSAISRVFGVSPCAIVDVVRGHTWKHLLKIEENSCNFLMINANCC